MSDCGDPDYHQYPDAHPISVRFMSSKVCYCIFIPDSDWCQRSFYSAYLIPAQELSRHSAGTYIHFCGHVSTDRRVPHQASPPSGPEAVLSLRISGRSTPSDPTSDDDNGPRHHYVLNGITPIDVEIRVTASSTDPHDLTFSVTTPVTPGPVVLSRPVSPFTSALLFPSDLTRHPPWHIPHPVCLFIIRSAFVLLTSPRS